MTTTDETPAPETHDTIPPSWLARLFHAVDDMDPVAFIVLAWLGCMLLLAGVALVVHFAGTSPSGQAALNSNGPFNGHTYTTGYR